MKLSYSFERICGILLSRSRECESHTGALLLGGFNFNSNLQNFCQSPAEIQSHPGGAASGPAVAPCISPVKNTGQLVGRDADSVVADGEIHVLSASMCTYSDNWVFFTVAGRIL